MKTFLFLLLCPFIALAQDSYIDSPKVATIYTYIEPSGKMLEISQYKPFSDKPDTKTLKQTVSFRFMGVNGRTIVVERQEVNQITKHKSVETLYFNLLSAKVTDITLRGLETSIPLGAEYANNTLYLTYQGSLPKLQTY